MNVNKAIIVGRVTADPQLRTTPSGQPVTSFSVATNRQWKDKNGAKQEDVEFHNVVAWGKTAEIASQYLKKGAMVFVEGRLKTRSWADKQNQTHRTTEIICERLQLGPRAAGTGGVDMGAGRAGKKADEPAEAPQAPIEEIPTVDIEDDIKMDDLPF
jgi:single-strand DNA-binding protein